jgi:tripartite-type tricarboxylate transporter receptor subunit TctC
LALFTWAVALACSPSRADTYPSHPIRFVVPHPPGGGTDVIARILAQPLGEMLHQSVVVDNKGGASGIIGTGIIAKAAPDGETIGFILSAHAVNPVLNSSLPYDSIKSFTPIILVGRNLFAVVVNPNKLHVNSLKELVDYAKANPGKVNAAISSIGSPGHLAIEKFKSDYHLNITVVPYKGSGDAVTDLVGGQVDMMVASFPAVRGFIDAGKLRALAVSTPQRSPIAPNVPTAAEQGFGGLGVYEWYGIVGPAGMDPKIVNLLNSDFNKVLKDPKVVQKLDSYGIAIAGGTARSFGDFMVEQDKTLGQIARDAHIKAE